MWGMFRTPTEKKRDDYFSLYNDLMSLETEFRSKVNAMSRKVSNYENSRHNMVDSYIPEDIFGVSEKNVQSQVSAIRDNQENDLKKLSVAVEAAYHRYVHYSHLSVQEAMAREAEKEAERRRKEAANKK